MEKISSLRGGEKSSIISGEKLSKKEFKRTIVGPYINGKLSLSTNPFQLIGSISIKQLILNRQITGKPGTNFKIFLAPNLVKLNEMAINLLNELKEPTRVAWGTMNQLQETYLQRITVTDVI